MISNAKTRIIILITLGILFALLPIITVNHSFITGNSDKSSDYSDDSNFDNENLKISAVSGKIHIINNSGWVAFKSAGNCTGTGTYSEPYVIEDLVIDANNTGNCILIENSDVYFKIENCTVFNSVAGIRLIYVNNSQLINNNCSSNSAGIRTEHCNNNTISGNHVINNYNGIYLNNSDNNAISGNHVSNNTFYGIIIRYSDNNAISGNNASNSIKHGISLSYSDNNTISENTANNVGPLDLIDPPNGIDLRDSDDNTISGNTANNNAWCGIYLSRSNRNFISGNTVIGNLRCILENPNCQGNNTFSDNGDCTWGQDEDDVIPIELIVVISVISGGAVIGVATLLLIRRKRKRT